MPSIKCTAKLGKRAGLKLEVPTEKSSDDWHANIFSFDRRFYVIFVHDETRLTCLAGPVTKPILQNMAKLLRDSLGTVLLDEGFREESIVHALSKLESMAIRKSDNRSVLGTINDNLFHVTYHAAYSDGMEGAGLSALAARVNHMPIKVIEWNYATNAYRRSIIHAA